MPDEDLHKIFKPIPPPSRLNALVLAGQTLSSADNVSQFCTQSLAKWFVTEALQKAKVDDNHKGRSKKNISLGIIPKYGRGALDSYFFVKVW